MLRPLVRLKTLLGIISIIWQSMGSWGAILIDSMNDNFLYGKYGKYGMKHQHKPSFQGLSGHINHLGL